MIQTEERAITRPDFIGIGQPLSGTGWVWKQLDSHTDTSLPPLKEFHFLDCGMASVAARRKLANLLSRRHQPNPRDEKHLNFLHAFFLDPISEELQLEQFRYQLAHQAVVRSLPRPDCSPITLSFRPEARHFNWYGSLFSAADGRVTGEITPRYCILDRDVIQSLANWAPELRIIMTIRHPVDRLISYLQKSIRAGQFAAQDLDDPALLHNVTFGNPIQQPFLHPTENYRAWSEIFGEDRIHLIFLEEIRDHPGDVRDRLCDFLGLDRNPSKFRRNMRENTKAHRSKIDISERIRASLTEALRTELDACADLFGGAARAYPE